MAAQYTTSRVGITVKKLKNFECQKFKNYFISHKINTTIHVDDQSRLLASDVSSDGNTALLLLTNNVLSFCIVDASELDASNDGLYILAITHKDTLSLELLLVERAAELKVTKRHQQLISSLYVDEDEPKPQDGAIKSPFVWFDTTSKFFVLLHHSEVFRVVVHSQGEVTISDGFLLEAVNEGDVTAVQQQGNFLFILFSTGDISIFNSTYFYPAAKVLFKDFCKVLFHKLSGTESAFTQDVSVFIVSPDLSHIVLTLNNAKYGIFKINLNEYFEHFPHHLCKNNSATTPTDSTLVQAGQSSQTWQGFMKATKSRLRSNNRKGKMNGPQCGYSQTWFEKVNKPPRTISLSSGKSFSKQISGFSARQSVASRQEKGAQLQQSKEAFVHSTAIKTPKHCRELTVGRLWITESTVVVWYEGNLSGKHGGVCTVSMECNDAEYYSFLEPTYLASPVESAQPIALICRDKLQLFAPGVNQDVLVNKLMIYKNASLAESVSHLNHWDHCSIPIHALEVGLKHRQLDTVAFFLKGRETEFRFKEPDPSTSLLSPSRKSTDASQRVETAEEYQLWTALELLAATIRDSMRDPQSRQYAQQLLNLTLTHLHKLVRNATEAMGKVTEVEECEVGSIEGFHGDAEDLRKVIAKLMHFITDMRKHLQGIPGAYLHDDTDGVEAHEGAWVGHQLDVGNCFDRWKDLPYQDVIKDGILSQKIPLVQAFFQEKQNKGSPTAESSASAMRKMQTLVQEGQRIAYNSLLSYDVDTARMLFHNMGFNVTSELKRICFFTANSSLRDFLIQTLRKAGHISPQEEDICLFINRLERLYTCQSFEKAKTLAEEGLMSLWKDEASKLFPLRDAKAEQFLKETLKAGEIVQSAETPNCENFHYAHILLNWVKHWDKPTQDRILLEQLIHSKSRDLSTKWSINSESAWQFLLAHEDWITLKCWIEHTFSPSESDSARSLPQIAPILQELTLERDFINRMDGCTSYFKDRVLDEMARYGVFCSKELANFNQLLTRFVRTGQLLVSPHTLSMTPEGQKFVESFNQWFIRYCIQHNLPAVMYMFVEFYNLCLSENEVLSMQLPLSEIPWLEILLNFRWVGKQVTDPALVFQASLANGRLFQKIVQPTVLTLLQEGHTMVALATLLYAPGTINEAFQKPTTSEENLWKVDSVLLQQALRPYPKLYSAVFPPEEMDGVSRQDVTVYQLLKGNMPITQKNLFSWQSTNNVTENTDNALTEMPHFANPGLVKLYAYTESFSFTHYLRQGRPSFAFSAFIINLMQENGNYTKYKISQAYLKSYCTAIRNISKLSVTAACVAFAEMLGKNSSQMRVDIHCATIILEHYKMELGLAEMTAKRSSERKAQETLEKKEKELAMLLLSCLKGCKFSARSVLVMLEGGISAKVSQQNYERTSWEASELWSLAVAFCQQHHLPYTSVYMSLCAENNRWLQFTCFAQIHQYPQQQILELVKTFKDLALRDHLKSAFENMKYGPAFVKHEEKPDSPEQSTRSTKNIRAKFYARSGVLPRTEDIHKHDSDGSSEEKSEEEIYVEDKEEFEESIPSDLDVRNIPEDFFGVIFQCNTHVLPHSALLAHAVLLNQPIFAVIASCYQNSSPLDCLSTWLMTSLNEKGRSKFKCSFKSVQSYQWHTWTLDELFALMQVALETGAISLIHKGFFIFDKNCPMTLFLKFCCEFLLRYDITAAKDYLDSFQSAIQKCKRLESIQQTQLESTHKPKIGNLTWYQESANQIAVFMLHTCSSQWELSSLLQLFSDVNFSFIVSSADPDFSQLYQLHLILRDTDQEKLFSKLIGCGKEQFHSECSFILEKLQDSDEFEKAKIFARLAKLPVDQLITHQVGKEFTKSLSSRASQSEEEKLSFWTRCNSLFKSSRVKPKTAASFFQQWVHRADSDVKLSTKEKAFLLHLAYQWMKTDSQTSEFDLLEREMWMARLNVEVEKRASPSGLASISQEFVQQSPTSQESEWECNFQGPPELLYVIGKLDSKTWLAADEISDQNKVALQNILSRLLQSGCIIQAHRLAAQFQYCYQDLEIVLACIQLAKGAIHPFQLDTGLKRLVGGSGRRQRKVSEWQQPRKPSSTFGASGTPPVMRRSVSVVSMPTNFVEQSVQHDMDDEVISTLESLTASCEDGKKCCQQIATLYQISKVLQKPYEEVVQMSPLNTLKPLLNAHDQERIELAKKFVETNSLSDNEVASFLTELVVTSLQKFFTRRREGRIGEANGNSAKQLLQGVVTRFANPVPLSSPWADRSEFGNLVKLCQNPVVLGNKLMEEVISLTRSYKDPTKQVLSLEVELLIRSHDCFSICCHMEGIANVLRSCREIFNTLTEVKECPLMVRLLLGVARYSEMMYIFDELRSKQQIELLLKKGSKDNSLKVSLLDYLKRCEPPDPDTYNMVAVKFGMVREIATLLEKEGVKKLKSLANRKMDTNLEVQNSLEEILQDFKNAAQNYAKADCLRHAERCVQQARLVALQLHLLSPGINVVGLTDDALMAFLTRHSSFHQAIIVYDAYNKQYDWSNAIFHHVVKRGDFTYFHDFRSAMNVTETLFIEVSQLYGKENVKDSTVMNNMKQFLMLCPDIVAKYRIATEYGFQDISSLLLQDENGAYLKDVAVAM